MGAKEELAAWDGSIASLFTVYITRSEFPPNSIEDPFSQVDNSNNDPEHSKHMTSSLFTVPGGGGGVGGREGLSYTGVTDCDV